MSLGFSAVSFVVSLYTFRAKRKSDQFKIAMDMNNRIQTFERKYTQIENRFKDSILESSYFEENSLVLDVLTTFNSFAFFVNNEEITDTRVQNYVFSLVHRFFEEREGLNKYKVEHLPKFDESERFTRKHGFTL